MSGFKLNAPRESFQFQIPSYGLDHQKGAVVDIAVALDFKEGVGDEDPNAYPEFVSIVNSIKDYLVNYPNEDDFWEILNKNLVTRLLTEEIPTTFGVKYQLDQIVDSLSVDIDVKSGSSRVNFPRSSWVSAAPLEGGAIDFDQSFSFEILDYGLDHQKGAIVDIFVDLDFKEDIAATNPFDYPEFVSIVDFIKNYLVSYPNEDDFWEILNKNLVTELLTEKIPTPFGVEYELDQLVETLTVDVVVEAGSSRVNFPRSSRVAGSPKQDGSIDFDQSFSFEILDYGLDHQKGAIVDIAVDLNFKEGIAATNPFDYPEFVSIVDFIKDYLVAYPNEDDFWEILNKNLVTELLTEKVPTPFGVEYELDQLVDSLTVDIAVEAGSSRVNFPRSSRVTGSPEQDGSIDFDQSFSFEILDYGLDHQKGAVVDIFVNMQFKEDIAATNPFDYPEFVSIVNFIKDYLVAYPNETDYWEILNKNLTEALLAQTIPTNFGVTYRLKEVVEDLTVDIQVESGSSRVDFPRQSTVSQSVSSVPAPELLRTGTDVFSLAGDAAGLPKLQVSLSGSGASGVKRLVLFRVDDAEGRIGDLDASQEGYAQAALARATSIFSAIADRPDGFTVADQRRLLPVASGEAFRFLLIQDDALAFDPGGKDGSHLFFTTPETTQISETGPGSYRLAWSGGSDSAVPFEELVIDIQASEAPLPLGAEAQQEPEGELLDLTGVDPTELVQANFVLNREAAFDNVVGLYRIADRQGSIVDPVSGETLRPGDNGYAQASIRSRVAGLELSVADQATATVRGELEGGGLYAPFLVVDGSLADLLDQRSDNDPAIYFPFIAANADRVDHVRLLGDNTIGFEDLRGGGDGDCNDVILRTTLSLPV